jgi:hypothetical protein
VNVAVNVPEEAAPLSAANVETAGPGGTVAPTVQVPFDCHDPGWPPLSMGSRYKFFEPEKFVLNVIAYVTVRLLPDTEPPAPDPVSEHWLFDSDPDPGVIGPSHVFPASFINRRVLPGRLNSTKHPAVPDSGSVAWVHFLISCRGE